MLHDERPNLLETRVSTNAYLLEDVTHRIASPYLGPFFQQERHFNLSNFFIASRERAERFVRNVVDIEALDDMLEGPLLQLVESQFCDDGSVQKVGLFQDTYCLQVYKPLLPRQETVFLDWTPSIVLSTLCASG